MAEHQGAARRSGDRTERRTASSPTVDAQRTRSLAALTHLVTVLGYPQHWADELERRAFAAGRVWTSTP